MKSYLIHLIRHGLTKGNLEGKYIGQKDVPLSIPGVSQLLELKKKYTYPEAQAYFSSPLSRCMDTMKILYPKVRPLLMDGLIEYDFGAFEGKSAKELEKDEQYAAWVAGGPDAAPPFGETNQAFAGRVCGTFSRIVDGLMKTGTTSAVICTHGGVIMTLLAAFGLPEAPMYEWMTANGAGYTLRITPGIWMRGRKLEVEALLPYGYSGEVEGSQAQLVEEGKQAMRDNRPGEEEGF